MEWWQILIIVTVALVFVDNIVANIVKAVMIKKALEDKHEKV